MEIQAGEGGEDSRIFVGELTSLYVRYAKSLNLKSEIIATSDSSCSLMVTGKKAGNAFKYESGKHVCQRVPPTETKGRWQTSVVSVAILPLPDNSIPLVKESDLEIKTQGGHGKGGQHQNTTDSAVRMKHKPTGINVFINGRDQHANRREALRIITAKVQEHEQQKRDSAYGNLRKVQMDGGGRGNKVRTYNFIKQRVVDHRLGTETRNIKKVMKGDLSLILN